MPEPFNEVLQHLETLPGVNAKIAYLIDAMTKAQQGRRSGRLGHI